MAEYQSTHTGQEHDAYCTKSQLINLVYPVGSIYMSINSTSPQTLFGGTWQQISDTFLLAAGSTYSAGSSGGNSEHTHNIAHTHTEGDLAAAVGASAGDPSSLSYIAASRNGRGPASVTSYTLQGGLHFTSYSRTFNHYTPVYGTTAEPSNGTSGTGSNMPPYLAVYMWKRTA